MSEYRTFRDWKSVGRFVRKGEKSVTRNEQGECVFSFEQTDEKYISYAKSSRGDCWNNPYYEDEDLAYEMDEIFGTYFDQC